MESIRKLYKIGNGPSSSHTMGPAVAAEKFLNDTPDADSYVVKLYGSLAATGKGHLTDEIILRILGKEKTKIHFKPEVVYRYHPNGVKFEAYKNGERIKKWLVFSVGGGSLKELDESRDEFSDETYPHKSMEEIIEFCEENNLNFYQYVLKYEGKEILDYLKEILSSMFNAINRGLFTNGILPGGLNVERKSASVYSEYLKYPSHETLVYAAALGVAEENASGGVIVTAPTCGASGVVPAVLYAEKIRNHVSETKIFEALCVAGLIGNLVKTNGSISGAEVGCQGEVGVACAMAAAALTYIKGGTLREIEYSAEIGLEHHLGMTCDPIDGLVQIPCIERNAMAAMQAYNCANYAILTKGVHRITFDDAIEVMEQTGRDLREEYRETSRGGLAYSRKRN